MLTDFPAPIFVLVRPQMGENIGAAARVMANFGLEQLRMVAPRDGWPNPQAEAMAAHAGGVLQHAQCVATLQEAVADCTHAVAITARKRRMTLPHGVLPGDEAMLLGKGSSPSALVFGPENHGLSTEEVLCCNAVLSIETNPDYASMNLAQAVAVCAYAWHALRGGNPKEDMPNIPPAPKQSLEHFYQTLEGALQEKGFFRMEEKKPHLQAQLRALLQRSALTKEEIQLLHGVVKILRE